MATMAKPASVFLCLLAMQCTLWMTVAVNEPNIDVNPTNINLGITSTLNINCSFSMDNNTAMVGFVSLILSRANSSGQNFEQLAAITEFSPDSVTLATQEKVLATGVHRHTGESFLLLIWDYPTSTQAGVYQCVAHGLDELGNNIEAVNTSVVTASKADINDVFELLKEMKIHEAAMQTEIQTLRENISQMGSHISDLKGTVAALKQFQPMNFLGTYQNTDYYLSRPGIGNYHAIIDVCKSYGGQLLEINDENEDKAIKGFLDKTSGFSWVLIGGSDDATEGTWLLPSTNQPLLYTDWRSDEPDNDETESCLMLSRGNTWQMSGEVCELEIPRHTYTYVCEIPR